MMFRSCRACFCCLEQVCASEMRCRGRSDAQQVLKQVPGALRGELVVGNRPGQHHWSVQLWSQGTSDPGTPDHSADCAILGNVGLTDACAQRVHYCVVGATARDLMVDRCWLLGYHCVGSLGRF